MDLQEAGLIVIRRSALGHESLESGARDVESRDSQPDVLLVDATGELRAWHYHATAVVVGKSFLGVGGQNPAESITAGKPVLFGPHMENFSAFVHRLLEHGGAVQVADFGELEKKLADILQSPEKSARLAQAGAEALRTHEGATGRTVSVLLRGSGK